MLRRPLQHEGVGPARQRPGQDRERRDLVAGGVVAVLGEKERRRVIVVEHLNHDPKEPTNLRHAGPWRASYCLT